MTSPYVTFAQPQPQTQPPKAPAVRRGAWPVVRAFLAVGAVLGALFAAAVAAFASAVTWTGCFIGCTGEDHTNGALLAALAVALLASGPAAVAGLYRSRAWWWVTGLTALAGAVFMTLALGSA